MGRRFGAPAIVLMTVLLTGCGPSAGNTAGTPTSAPPPSPFVPAAGTCHATVEPIAPRNKYAPVDCAGKHRAETAYVGTFTGPDADRGTPRQRTRTPTRERSRAAVRKPRNTSAPTGAAAC
ncbi:hypothetical protein GCM10027605_49620 [Micromonospora zhanjiangensis]